jgi:hypothetical protein
MYLEKVDTWNKHKNFEQKASYVGILKDTDEKRESGSEAGSGTGPYRNTCTEKKGHLKSLLSQR